MISRILALFGYVKASESTKREKFLQKKIKFLDREYESTFLKLKELEFAYKELQKENRKLFNKTKDAKQLLESFDNYHNRSNK